MIPWRYDQPISIPLVKESDVPDGFIYVPSGPVSYGGDAVSFQAMNRDEEVIEGFFIGRFEVTFAEYMRFINAPAIFEVTDEKGDMVLRVPSSLERVKRLPEQRIRIVPSFSRLGDRILVRKAAERLWDFAPGARTKYLPSSPVMGVPQLAALEYARWLNGRNNDRWRYRLPDDREWEKAARGVDRREFVWGNYLV